VIDVGTLVEIFHRVDIVTVAVVVAGFWRADRRMLTVETMLHDHLDGHE